MTRQQRWQEKMRDKGRCVTCGEKVAPSSFLRCEKHLAIRRKNQKAIWAASSKKPLRQAK